MASSSASEYTIPPVLVEVGAHPIGVDLEAVEDVGRGARRVGGDAQRPLEDEPLRRAVADVALVPQRHVLEADERIGSQQPRHAGHPLGEDRIALVRHGARPLLAGAERLECLAHLGALKVTDLDRDALERAAEDGQRG